MEDNRQFYFDIVDMCCAESDKHLTHLEKMQTVNDLLDLFPTYKKNDHGYSLKNYVFVKHDMDRFNKTKKIAYNLGIKFK